MGLQRVVTAQVTATVEEAVHVEVQNSIIIWHICISPSLQLQRLRLMED